MARKRRLDSFNNDPLMWRWASDGPLWPALIACGVLYAIIKWRQQSTFMQPFARDQ